MDWNWTPARRARAEPDSEVYGTKSEEQEWVWEPVRIDRTGQLYRSAGRGILREEVHDCAFCRGTGEKPKGSRCPVCRGKRVVSVTPPAVVCAYCKGRGEERPRTNITCPVCKGKRIVPVREPIETCPGCRGRGVPRGSSLYCVRCRGTGVVTVKPSVRRMGRVPANLQITVAGDAHLTTEEAEEVVTRPGGSEREVLEILEELGAAGSAAIGGRMGVSSTYAEHVCDSLRTRGYLSKTGRLFALASKGKTALEKVEVT